uniref:Cyclic nucleotide-gated cation channel beta-3-like n=1 Tax=Acanthochromis polyacanthus TaxID=80966 RepID=A0A3Q1GN65_9TELE
EKKDEKEQPKEEEKKEEPKKEEEKKEEPNKEEEKKEEPKKEEEEKKEEEAKKEEPQPGEISACLVFAEEAPPPPPPPVVYFRYTDDTLRELAKKLKERTAELKEKAIDPYATSPEVTPPVTPILLKDDYIRLKEEERIAKEEADKKKAEEAAKKAEEKKKKDEEKRLEAEKKAEEERMAEEARKKAKILPEITCSCFDVLFHPIEVMMDSVLGNTIDPFTDRRYIAWLTVVAVAYNYNVWFSTARLAFPYHNDTANRFWIFFDVLSDAVNVIDIIIWQPRLQFVKAGDIIKDGAMTKVHYRKSPRFKIDMISILPLDLLCLHFEFSSVYRLNRFVRIDSFFEFSDRLESIMAKAYIWSILFMFFYLICVYLLNFTSMRDVIGAATAGQTYFRASMDGCVEYMNTYTIPKLCQNRVRMWYNYTWAAQGMLDESELLDKMPLVMKTAIAVDINLRWKGCDQQMLVDMLLRLKSIIYLPGDFVVKKGDIGKEMYIIKSGAVQVVGGPDNSIVFVTLKAGCVFGEISLLQSAKDGGNRRTANVKAHGFANLFVLEKKDLFDILVHYPESQKVLARKGRKLTKAKGPAGAKPEEKPKGIALFGQKPPTPKLLKAFGNFRKGGVVDKLKVKPLH